MLLFLVCVHLLCWDASLRKRDVCLHSQVHQALLTPVTTTITAAHVEPSATSRTTIEFIPTCEPQEEADALASLHVGICVHTCLPPPNTHIYVMSCTYNVSVYVCTCQYIACSSCAGALAPPDVWVGVEVVVCDACSGTTTYFFLSPSPPYVALPATKKKGSGLKGKKNFK